MLNQINDDGQELDARFSVELRSYGFDLIVESRGGSSHGPNAARNSDYAKAMELHLSRAAALNLILKDVQVASSNAMKLPDGERSVILDRFEFPLKLDLVNDFRWLRHSIGRASAAFGRTDGSDRGNRTKRMRLCLSYPRTNDVDVRSIEALLTAPAENVSVTEEQTANPDELENRVEIALFRTRTKAKSGFTSPPPGNASVESADCVVTRFTRDPNVIAWVLFSADGRCEVCDSSAPFQRTGGEPYLEVHHVRPLSEGGPDTTDNVVACCPNCHRQLHFGEDRSSLREKLILKVSRLIDYPELV